MSEPVRLCRESGRPGYFLCEDGEDAELLALPRAEFEALQARATAAEGLLREARGWLTDRWEGEERALCGRIDAALTPPPPPQPEV